jgi:hypothetical protein
MQAFPHLGRSVFRRLLWKWVEGENGESSKVIVAWKNSIAGNEKRYLFDLPVPGHLSDAEDQYDAAYQAVCKFLATFQYYLRGDRILLSQGFPSDYSFAYHMVSKNLIYCRVEGSVSHDPSIPVIKCQYSALKYFEQAGDCLGYKNVGRCAERSFISTANHNAVVNAINKISRPTTTHNCPGEILLQGLAMARALVSLDKVDKVPPPTWRYDKVVKMTFPSRKKMGYSIVAPMYRDGDQLIGDIDGYKGDVFLQNVMYLNNVIKGMRSDYRSKGTDEERFHLMRMRLESIAALLVKMAMKPELRLPGDDPEKVRVFFLVGMLHYLVAKILCEPIHDYLMFRLPYAVGFRWLGGGAKFLYDYLKGGDTARTFYCTDISQKDVSFTAVDIAVLLMQSLSVYDLKDDEESTITRIMMEWLIANTSYHVVNWPGGFRFVIGILFSGDYNTSFLNTFHLVVVNCCFCIHMYNAVKDKRCLVAMRDGAWIPVIQGDDQIGSYSDEIASLGMTSDAFVGYLQSVWNMKVKPEAYRKSRSLLAKEKFAPGVSGKPIPTGMLETPVEEQIVFLKRILVMQNGVVRPFRPIHDIIYRLHRSASDILTPYDVLAKLIGLSLDTMGVNVQAYRLCNKSIELILKNEFNGENGGYVDEKGREFRYQALFDALKSEKFAQERMYKMGLQTMEPMEIVQLAGSRAKLLAILDGEIDSGDSKWYQKQSAFERPVRHSLY